MSEEFFERLVGRALHIDRREDESNKELLAFVRGVHATREALKEMMVGEGYFIDSESGEDAVVWDGPFGMFDFIAFPRANAGV